MDDVIKDKFREISILVIFLQHIQLRLDRIGYFGRAFGGIAAVKEDVVVDKFLVARVLQVETMHMWVD